MKLAFFILSSLFSSMAFAQNLAFSCDNQDFHIEGTIIEDAHGYVFEVKDISFLVKDTSPALTGLTGSSKATHSGREINFTLPDGRKVVLYLVDYGDSDYSEAVGVLDVREFVGKFRNLSCASSSVR